MAFWGAISKNLEFYVPLFIGLPPGVANVVKDFCPQQTARNYYEAKRNGKAVGFTEQMEETVLDELTVFADCPDKDRDLEEQLTILREPLSAKYRFFVSDDLLGTVIGSPRFMFSDVCCVGLPYNISYESVEDVARDYERLKMIPRPRTLFSWFTGLFGDDNRYPKIEWGSEVGVKLMNTLILSKDEKGFLIQRSIQQADAVNQAVFDLLPSTGPILLAGLLNYVVKFVDDKNYRRHLRKPSRWPFFIASTLTGVIGAIWARKYARFYCDTKADCLTASIGEPYAQAGVSYYKKLMQRNRCINELLEKAKLPKVYEKDGDYAQRYIIRVPQTSLKQRIKLIMETAEAKKKEKEAMDSPFH